MTTTTDQTDYRLIDSTLRDGSHAISHQYHDEDVIRIVKGLDAAGVQVIEIAHGDGLGGSSFNYGFSAVPEKELIAKACEVTTNAKIACLLLPGIGLADDLREVSEMGVQVARIAVHCTEADITEQHIKVAKGLGMEAIGFLMMAHMNTPEGLVEQALLMQSYGADTIYIADSAGAMTTEDVKVRVNALVQALDVPLGVHAHNNLAMAVSNSIAAFQEGAKNLDGTSAGLGAGAGNCPTEILAAVVRQVRHQHRRRRPQAHGPRRGGRPAPHAPPAGHRPRRPHPRLRRRLRLLPPARRTRRQPLQRLPGRDPPRTRPTPGRRRTRGHDHRRRPRTRRQARRPGGTGMTGVP